MTTLAVAVATLLAMQGAAVSDLHVDGSQFKDAHGRVVILRGANVAGDAKIPPFMPIQRASMLDGMPELGLNVQRFLVNWEAFEPTRGAYSAAYLDYVEQAVTWAWERGVYTLIDFHQDAMSRTLVKGCGEGFPEWATPAYVKHFTPNNGPRCAKWWAMMWVDRDLWRAWRAFFADEGGVRQAYANMAGRVAQRLANTPGVIGYDLMNEPVGDEVNELAPFYALVGGAIRAVHKEAILFLGPHVRVDIGLGSHLPKPALDNIAYAPHFYDVMATVTGHYLGNSFRHAFASMLAKSQELNGPLFLAEFGSSPQTGNTQGYMRTLYDRFDDHFLSGAQWSFTPGWSVTAKDGWNVEDLSIIDANGRLRDNFTPRPYGQKIAGTPIFQKLHANPGTGSTLFEISWLNNPAAGPTEIFVPRGQGTRLEAIGDDLNCVHADLVVRCEAASAGLKKVLIYP